MKFLILLTVVAGAASFLYFLWFSNFWGPSELPAKIFLGVSSFIAAVLSLAVILWLILLGIKLLSKREKRRGRSIRIFH